MTVPKIDYLEWARTHMDRVKIDLAKSNVKEVTLQELEITIDDLNIQDPNAKLVQLLADRYHVEPQNVLMTNGATQGIFLACHAILNRGDEVLLESPNYEPLPRVLSFLEAHVRILDRRFKRGFQIDLEDVERSISRNTQAIFMTNLHNPSGIATHPERLETLGKIAHDHGAYLMCDEVYLDNAFQKDLRPVASYGKRRISIGSLSKIYGLGRLRIGWIIADAEIIEQANIMADYISGGLSLPTQAIAYKALTQADRLIDRCNKIVQPNIDRIRDWVQSREDLKWIEPDGGTICVIRLAPQFDSYRLFELLREKYDTLVSPGDFFRLRGFIRVSFGMDEEILETGLKNISSALEELKSGR